MAKPKASSKPRQQPEGVTIRQNVDQKLVRELAANQRVGSVIAHLANAGEQIDAALADLSSVIGAADLWRDINKLAHQLKVARYQISDEHSDASLKAKSWSLDHTPKSVGDTNHGCGLYKGSDK